MIWMCISFFVFRYFFEFINWFVLFKIDPNSVFAWGLSLSLFNFYMKSIKYFAISHCQIPNRILNPQQWTGRVYIEYEKLTVFILLIELKIQRLCSDQNLYNGIEWSTFGLRKDKVLALLLLLRQLSIYSLSKQILFSFAQNENHNWTNAINEVNENSKRKINNEMNKSKFCTKNTFRSSVNSKLIWF